MLLPLPQDAIDVTMKHFPRYKPLLIRFMSNALPSFEYEMTEISPEAWDDIVPLLGSVTVTVAAASSVNETSITVNGGAANAGNDRVTLHAKLSLQ